jgi:hypothetical protein
MMIERAQCALEPVGRVHKDQAHQHSVTCICTGGIMVNGPLVQITIRGGNVGIVNNQIYAALLDGVPATTTWIVTAADNGTLQFTDQAGGLILGAPGTDVSTQATAAAADSGIPVTSWSVTQYSDQGEDDPDPIKDPSRLTSGYYAIQEPSTGEFLFRNPIEDYSLRPKVVALQSADQDQGPLVIKVVNS